MNLCPICSKQHNKNHVIVDYEKKIINVIYIMSHIFHIIINEKKICLLCENEHREH